MKQFNDEHLMEQMTGLVQQFRRQIAGGDAIRGPHGHHDHSKEDHNNHCHGDHGHKHHGSDHHSPDHCHDHRRQRCSERHECERTCSDRSKHQSSCPEADGRHGSGHDGKRHSHDHRPPMGRERVLRLIGQEEGISQRNLAETLSIRPQSLSELLGKLERDGYITRTQNQTDKRETLVSLTETGKARAEEVEQNRAAQIAKLFDPLTMEEKETLSGLLAKLLTPPAEE